MRNPLDGRQGVNERIMLRELLRRVDMMVHPGEPARRSRPPAHAASPPGKIGGAPQPGTIQNLRAEVASTARMPG